MSIFVNLLSFSLYQGLVFGLVAIGVYLTLRVLAFPDLTVEGSFPLGAATAAVLIVHGINPFLAALIAFCTGLIAGLMTGILNSKLRIPALLAGILMDVALYSINLMIMNGANIALLRQATIFSIVAGFLGLGVNSIGVSLTVAVVIAVVFFFLLNWFLHTEIGLSLRASGENEQMVRSLGIDTDKNIMMGCSISNGLVALAGAVIAQGQGFADVGMGLGVLVIGLASVIVGEALFRPFGVARMLLAVTGGSFVYQLAIGIALRLGLPPGDIKLITAVLVIFALAIPFVRKKLAHEWVPPAVRW